MRLLLINDTVRGYETFVSASKENTEVILYNTENDSYATILNKKKGEIYESVGIIDYNYGLPYYTLTKNESNIFSQGIDEFINFLKSFNAPIVDFMACELFSEEQWKNVFSAIENEGINVRSSIDKTGNLWAGGNWVMESEIEPVNVMDLYFTSRIEEYAYLLDDIFIQFYGDRNINEETDDYIICRSVFGGFGFLYKNFKKVWISVYRPTFNTYRGYWLVDISGNIIDNIENVYGNGSGILITTTTYAYIYYFGTDTFARPITNGPEGPFVTDITDIKFNRNSFSFKLDGLVYSIGQSSVGGQALYWATPIRLENGTTGPFLTNIQEVYSNANVYSAKGDSGVYTWGNAGAGGINTSFATKVRLENGSTGPFLTDVQEVYSAQAAFAAKGNSGVYTWGSSNGGGINTAFATQVRLENGTTGPFLTDVQEVYTNEGAFAVKGDSGVYAWGSFFGGGINTSFATQVRLENGTTGPFLTDVQSIIGGFDFFVARGNSGVYSWGNSGGGGINTGFATQVRSENGVTGPFLENIESIDTCQFGWSAKGPSGIYVCGNLLNTNIWPSTYARQVKLYGETGPDITGTEIIPGSDNFIVKDGSTLYYIYPGSLTPVVYTDYNIAKGSLSPLVYNNISLLTPLAQVPPMTEIVKSKSNNLIGSTITSNFSANIFNIDGKIFGMGNSPSWGGISNTGLLALPHRIGDSFIGPFLTDIQEVYTNSKFIVTPAGAAFVARGVDSVYAWGNTSNGGINTLFATQVRLENGITGPFLTDVQAISSNISAFAVRGSSGVYAWGNNSNGGINSVAFATQVRLENGTTGPFLTDVQEVHSNGRAFTVKGNSGVYAWGFNFAGGINTGFATQVRLENGSTGPFLTDVQEVYNTELAFAVRGSSGVYAWGSSISGGINSAAFATQVRLGNGSTGPFLTDVQAISSNSGAFAVRGSSGVYTWGPSFNGGINTSFATQVRLENGSTGPFLTDVQEVYNNSQAFAVRGSSGVYALGNTGIGGINTDFATQVRLENGSTGPFLTDVQEVYSAQFAFAVRGSSGVYAWGDTGNGGINTGFATQVRLENGSTGPFLTDVQEVYNNDRAFAVKGDSGVYAWGNIGNGGIGSTTFATQVRVNSANGPFLTDVEEIYGYGSYFLARTTDNYYGWGGGLPGLSATFAQLITGAEYNEIIKPVIPENTNINLITNTTTVEELLNKSNSSAEGIAIAKATNWRYKIPASDWKTIEDVDDSNALLLLKPTELEFLSSKSSNSKEVPDSSLIFVGWNGEVGDEGDYLNTNIEYFNLTSDNGATVMVEEKTPSSDSSTLRIIMIAILVAIVIVAIFFIIYIWSSPSKYTIFPKASKVI